MPTPSSACADAPPRTLRGPLQLACSRVLAFKLVLSNNIGVSGSPGGTKCSAGVGPLQYHEPAARRSSFLPAATCTPSQCMQPQSPPPPPAPAIPAHLHAAHSSCPPSAATPSHCMQPPPAPPQPAATPSHCMKPSPAAPRPPAATASHCMQPPPAAPPPAATTSHYMQPLPVPLSLHAAPLTDLPPAATPSH